MIRLTAVLLLVCSSCVPISPRPERLDTPSGRPEVTLQGVTAEQASAAALGHYAAAGWAVIDQSPNQLVLQRQAEGQDALFFFKRERRLIFVPTADGVRLLAQDSALVAYKFGEER